MTSRLQLSPALALLVAVALVALVIVNYRFAGSPAEGSAFFWRWARAAGWISGEVEPYEPISTDAFARRVPAFTAPPAAGSSVPAFDLALPAMVTYVPFGLLPSQLAESIWRSLSVFGLIAAGLAGLMLTNKEVRVYELGLISTLPFAWATGALAVFAQTAAPIQAGLLGLSLLALLRGSEGLAALLASLSVLPQPALVAPIALLALLWGLSSRRLLYALLPLTTLLVLSVAALALDTGWPVSWLRSMLPGPDLAAAVNLTAVIWLLVLTYLLWEWIGALRQPVRRYTWTALLTLTLGSAIPLSGGAVLAITPMMAVNGSLASRWGRSGSRAGWIGLAAISTGSWMALRGGSAGLRAFELALVVIIVLGLWWTRWWATERTELAASEPSA